MTGANNVDEYPTQPLARPNLDRDPGEEEIATPAPHAHLPVVGTRTPPPAHRSGLLGVLVGISLVMSLAALALSVAMINSLSGAQRTAVEGLDAAIGALEDLEGEGFHYEYHFERTIPVSSSIPIEQEMVIPFSGDFPINTTVKVPIDAGVLGRFNIDVPINTSVHVDTEVPVSIDQTFDISTTIPVSMVIPIDVRPDDPAVQDAISRMLDWLLELRDSLNTGLRFPLSLD